MKRSLVASIFLRLFTALLQLIQLAIGAAVQDRLRDSPTQQTLARMTTTATLATTPAGPWVFSELIFRTPRLFTD